MSAVGDLPMYVPGSLGLGVAHIKQAQVWEAARSCAGGVRIEYLKKLFVGTPRGFVGSGGNDGGGEYVSRCSGVRKFSSLSRFSEP